MGSGVGSEIQPAHYTWVSKHLLIRAHGEPPSTYRLAEKYQIQVIDGTCPIVEKLQTKIRRVYDSMDHEKEQLVIFGISDHPETIGLLGHVNQHALVVSTLDDLRKVDPAKRVHLFSQTTMDPEAFREIEEGLREYLQEHESPSFHSACTICGQMKKRKPYLAKFAQTHDLILFVSGKSSSNGKMLFEYSRSINPSTFWISNPGEINPVWLEGASSIGVSGATSTSREQLEAIVEHLHNMG